MSSRHEAAGATAPGLDAARRDRTTAVFVAADSLALLWAGVTSGAGTAGLLLALGAVLALAAQGVYRRRLSGGIAGFVPRALVACAVSALLIGLITDADRLPNLLRGAAAALVALVVIRFLVDRLVTSRRRRRRTQPALIIGAGEVARRLAQVLRDRPELGLDPIGYLDDVDDPQLPVLGGVSDLCRVIGETGARHVIIAFGVTRESELVSAVRDCPADVEVWAVPRFFELGLHGPSANSDSLGGLGITRLPRKALRSSEWRMKRAFDVVVSSVGLVAVAPVLVAVAIAVKLTSRGPVFFRQERVGQLGRMFELLKFRSLLVNDDAATTWDVTTDDRVTSVGRIIRRASIDELPQLFNVLRGDMSLVGPRPERPYFVDLFGGSVRGYHDRHRVPVGLTGLAQVSGLRGDTSIEERAVFDNLYIERWSLWGDLVILVRTLAAVVNPPESVRCAPAPVVIDLRDPQPADGLPELAVDTVAS